MSGTVVRWATKHGFARLGISAAARKGDIQARYFVDPEVRADPYPFYDRIREQGPLVRGSLMWATARHDVASAVLRSDAFGVGFSDRRLPAPVALLWRLGRRTTPIGPVDPPSMLVTDPPDHTRYRRLVAKVFTARAIEGLRPKIEQTAQELLSDLGPRFDLVERYAALLPVTVIADILGVPMAMRRQFLDWGTMAAPTLDLGLTFRQYRRTEIGIRRSNAWMRGHFERLRARPGDDLLSQLVHLEGEQLTDDELLATAGLLLAAGFETTVNLLGTGAALLMTHPDELGKLRDDPGRWRGAVEEMLRYDSPVQNTARVCQRPVEIAGVRLQPGHVVVPMLGGANRDPAVFDDPGRFDVTRPNARDHLSFSGGVHYCLGAALARLEGEIGLKALFDRHPGLVIDGTPRRRRTRVLRGYASLPVAAPVTV
ncbi:cytochrome P450 [Dactylosporangium aurantiacum]|uniref:Cytochrome P450 n=1 Tax=Dactylosporangium aurantiacum TaxID=35754 RepID=A0A9Q9IDM5_9ACTN|nr:cytochrome P450 [Dactylosporangium aurantiacum]MDG6103365.1 cytochrome P450 [Dactylosporangium aurantiacum]UWZ52117.1 cytochrome P450 [Dactylosporangium aurantiacum]